MGPKRCIQAFSTSLGAIYILCVWVCLLRSRDSLGGLRGHLPMAPKVQHLLRPLSFRTPKLQSQFLCPD